MAYKIQLRRGLKKNLPTLAQGEPAFTTDSREFYIGTGKANIDVGGSTWYFGTHMTSTLGGNIHTYSACPDVKVGDVYLNTSIGNIYRCAVAGSANNAKWAYMGNMMTETPSTSTSADMDSICGMLAVLGLLKATFKIADDTGSSATFVPVWSGKDFGYMEAGYYYLPAVPRKIDSLGDDGSQVIRALDGEIEAGKCALILWNTEDKPLEIAWKG